MNTQGRAIPQAAPVMGIREWGLILFLALIWGGSFFFVGVAVRELPPLTIVLSRVGLASALLLALLRVQGKHLPRDLSTWGSFMVMGFINNALPFCLIVWGQTHIPSGLASIFNATTPIFAVLLAHFVTRTEALTLNRGAGVIMGWTGVCLLMGWDALQGMGLTTLGQAAVLGAACCYAVAALFGRRFSQMDPMVVSTGMLCCATLLLLPPALVLDQPWHLSVSLATLAALFSLAAVSTALAYVIYFYLLPIAGPTNLLLVTFLIPVSAIGLGVIFLGERLGWNAFAGMGGIFLGLLLIDGRIIDRVKSHRPN